MADSAMMRAAIATLPRPGRTQGRGARVIGIVSALIWASPLLVSAVRIFRMLLIPQRAAACDRRNRSEVVSRGRGVYRPFERPCIPWIVAGLCSLPVRNDKVADKQQNSYSPNKRPDCDD